MKVKRRIGFFSPLILLFCFSCQPEPTEITQSTAIERHLSDFEPATNEWGFIDLSGREVIPAQFDDVRPFAEGLAAVNDDGLWGYINPKGTFVIPPEFIKAHNFHDGVARVRGSNGKMGLINPTGDTIAAFVYDEIYTTQFGKYLVEINFKKGVIDQEGTILLEPSFEDVVLLTSDLYGTKNKANYDIINNEGDVLLEELQVVAADGRARQNDRWGVLGSDGGWIIPPTFDALSDGGPEKMVVHQGDSFGLLNLQNREVLFLSTTPLRYLGDGRYTHRTENGWRLLSESGSTIRQLPVTSIYPFNEGIAAIEVDGWWGYIDQSGTVKVQPMFALPWVSHQGHLRLFTREGFGFHDHEGKVMISPRFRDVRDFSESLAAFQE